MYPEGGMGHAAPPLLKAPSAGDLAPRKADLGVQTCPGGGETGPPSHRRRVEAQRLQLLADLVHGALGVLGLASSATFSAILPPMGPVVHGMVLYGRCSYD